MLEEPATKASVAEKLDATGSAGPEEVLRNAAAQDDGFADDDLDTIRRLTKEIHEPLKPDSEEMDETENAKPKEPLRDNPIQDDVTIDSGLEEIYKVTQSNHELNKDGIGETEHAGPKGRPGNAAQENVTTDDTGGNAPGELKEPVTEKSAAEGTYKVAGRSTEEPLRDTTTGDSGNHNRWTLTTRGTRARRPVWRISP